MGGARRTKELSWDGWEVAEDERGKIHGRSIKRGSYVLGPTWRAGSISKEEDRWTTGGTDKRGIQGRQRDRDRMCILGSVAGRGRVYSGVRRRRYMGVVTGDEGMGSA